VKYVDLLKSQLIFLQIPLYKELSGNGNQQARGSEAIDVKSVWCDYTLEPMRSSRGK
jgi:hypothetical protein